MGIIKKIDNKGVKIRYSLENLMLNPDSPLLCDKCKSRLGILRMMSKALFKKKGSKYIVICKHCKTKNMRVKGQIGMDIDDRWNKYGFQ
jgi:RNase P subunit RPR2